MLWLIPLIVLVILLLGVRRLTWAVRNPIKALLILLVIFVGAEVVFWLSFEGGSDRDPIQFLALGGIAVVLIWASWPYFRER